MLHALMILLHRPFISGGHLAQVGDTVSTFSLNACINAARSIDALLRWYKSQFCMTTPPYFITYAIYASATIHVRVAGQQQTVEKAPYEPLLNCLEILSDQSRRNRATSKMLQVLLELVKRLDIEIGGAFAEDGSWARDTGEQENELSAPAIFLMSPGILGSTDNFSVPLGGMDSAGMDAGGWSLIPELFFDVDPLFGFQTTIGELESGFGGL